MIERLPLISLLAGCAFFAALIVAEIAATPDREIEPASAIPTRVEAPLSMVHPEVGSSPYDSMVAVILARPLFDATRRPPPRGDNPAADTAFDDSRLAGIVTEPGHRFAIFAPTGAKPVVVTEGDTLSGWRVDSITPREVSLSGPGGTKTLQPRIDPNLAPPSPPAAAPVQLPVRPGFPPALFSRAPMRPGQFRERR